MTAGGAVAQLQLLARVVALLFAGLLIVAVVGLWRVVQPGSEAVPAAGLAVTVKAPTGVTCRRLSGGIYSAADVHCRSLNR